MTSMTYGINHLGLTVVDIHATAAFFTEVLAWTASGYDPSYPRIAVSDGSCRLTLWQVSNPSNHRDFDRKNAVGLHHLALELDSEEDLNQLADKIAAWDGADVEFMPEPMGNGPRKHMMLVLKGGPRLELTWPGPK